MTQEPEALRLAAKMDLMLGWDCCKEAAAEVRRLHAENERMASELSRPMSSEATVILHDNRRLRNINRQLLEALRQIVELHGQWNNGVWAANIARAAIKAAKQNI